MENEIKQIVLDAGADVCGIAGIERFADAPDGFSPVNIFPACRSVIVLGLNLPKGLTKVDPRLVYGHYNYQLCPEADGAAIRSAKLIEKRFGALAVPLPSDSPYEYWDEESLTGRGLISMKHAAVLAGLGTLGKNSLLINPEYGNLLTIGAILTDMELKSDPLCAPMCIEGCRRCIDACPVKAIQNGGVVQKLCRGNTYHQTARGFGTVDCNRCRMVCPMRFGRKGEQSRG